MKTIITAAIVASLGVAYQTTAAATDASQSAPSVTSPYRDNEFSLDVFGTGTVGQQTIDHISGDRIRQNGRLGAGFGANFFFTRYLGISGDAYTENTEHSFIDSTSGNLVARLPLGDSGLAPYIFGGGGYQFDNVEQSFGQAGGGLEFRFTDQWGIFADARYVIADKTENYGMARAGLRLGF